MKKKNQNKKLSFIILILLILILGSFIFFNYQKPRVCFEENCFFVEIALTENEKARGLMFRNSLDENKGMIFVFPEPGIYNFWMKNTLIPLDIIWINSEKEIIHIEHNAQPCGETCKTIGPLENAVFVLEINAGLAEKLNISLGDVVSLEL